MNRRELLRAMAVSLPFLPAIAAGVNLWESASKRPGSKSSERTESLEETRRSMCDSIRTDPAMAIDAISFRNAWGVELGRIIGLAPGSPS